MADKLVPSDDDTGAIRRFRDMGDGTYAEVVSQAAGAAGAAGYPAGATPVGATSGTVANATASASLPAAVGKRTYVTSLQITGSGATAAGIATASLGALGGPYSYSLGVVAGASLANPAFVLNFNPPLPATADNTAITLAIPALGAGNVASQVSLQGFQL